VQSKAPAVEVIEQQSADNDRVEKEVGIETDLGLIHPLISTEMKARPSCYSGTATQKRLGWDALWSLKGASIHIAVASAF
jgi:hypothetical protein